MEVISLQSGSNGNCIYVEIDSVRLLIDAGITGRTAQERLGRFGKSIRAVDALLVSHDHHDHSRSMGVFHRMFKLPVFSTAGTYVAAGQTQRLGAIEKPRFFKAGAKLSFGSVTVETIPTPHDGSDGVAFVIESGDKRVGILTDLGHVFDGLLDVLLSLDAVLIESNYDERMLAGGPYPERLKRRIRGPAGHLSNREAAELVARAACFKRLQWACLCHLSAENNTPEIALRTHRAALGKDFPLYIASRHSASDVMRVRHFDRVAG